MEKRVVWHKPSAKKTPDQEALSWKFRQRTYDLSSQVQNESISSINFLDYNISNPVLARSIVAFTELSLLTMDALPARLNRYYSYKQTHSINSSQETLSYFLNHSYSKQEGKENLKVLYLSSGALTGSTLDVILGTKAQAVLPLFDKIIRVGKSVDKQENALKAIDTYASFYNTSRHIILTVAEKMTKDFGIQLETENTKENSKLQPVKDAIIKSSKAEDRDLLSQMGLDMSLMDKGFKAYYNSVNDFFYAYMSLFSRRKKNNASISDVQQKGLREIYETELLSGISFLLQENFKEGLVDQHKRRYFTETYYDEKNRVYRTDLYVTSVTDPEGDGKHNLKIFNTVSIEEESLPELRGAGRCPFVEVGWQQM